MIGRLIARLWYGPEKKPTLTPDDSSGAALVPGTSPQHTSLDDFKQKLESKKQRMNELLVLWEGYKTKLVSSENSQIEHDHGEQCEVEKDDHAGSIVKEFARKLKGYFETASTNLQEQLDAEVDSDGHIKRLEKHIVELCAKAKAAKTEDENRDIKIHICNASIVLINELKLLTTGFAEEIAYSVKVEQREEEAVKLALNVVLALISGFVGMSLPLIDFNCNAHFEELLNRTITKQEAQYEMEEAEAEGDLEKARQVIEGGYVAALRKSGGSVNVPSAEVLENNVEATAQLRPL